MLWHRQAIFESKGDKLASSAECWVRIQGLWNRISIRWQRLTKIRIYISKYIHCFVWDAINYSFMPYFQMRFNYSTVEIWAWMSYFIPLSCVTWMTYCLVKLHWQKGSKKTVLSTNYTSTVYWCIASKLKVLLIFFMEWTTRFCVLIYHLSISLTLAVLQRQKSLPDICGTTKMSAAWLPWDSSWSLASTPWAMSLYFKFRAIYFWLLNEY